MADLKYEQCFLVSGYGSTVTENALKEYFGEFAPVHSVMKMNEASSIIKFVEKQELTKLRRQFVFDRRLLTVKTVGGVQLSPSGVAEQQREAQKSATKRPTTGGNLSDRVQASDAEGQFTARLHRASNVCQQMYLAMQHLEMTADEIRLREHVYRSLLALFKQHFQQFDLNIFGSSVTGLGLKNCDIDLVLTLFPDGLGYMKYQESTDKKFLQNILHRERRLVNLGDLRCVKMMTILHFVKWILLKRNYEYLNPFAICSNVVPLIKFKLANHPNISCDLSIKNKLAVHNTEFIKLCINMDPRFKPMMFAIKWWFKMRHAKVALPNRFNSYTLAMLVIFFLENASPPVFPTIRMLQEIGPVVRVDGWNCGFCDDLRSIPPTENFQPQDELLRDFFRFYANFKFDELVICPLTGEAVQKQVFASIDERFKVTSFCVQDPFELCRNIAGNVAERSSRFTIEEFKRAAALTAESGFYEPTDDFLIPWGLQSLFVQNDTASKKKRRKLASAPALPAASSTSDNAKRIVSADVSSPSKAKIITADAPTADNIETEFVREQCFIRLPNPVCYPQLRRVASSAADVFQFMTEALYKSLSGGLKMNCRKVEHDLNHNLPDADKCAVTVRKRKSDSDNDQRPSKKFITDAAVAASVSSGEDVSYVSPTSTAGEIRPSTSKDANDALKPTQTVFDCEVSYKFWDDRKNIAKVMKHRSADPIATEARISEVLIENVSNTFAQPLRFTVKVHQHVASQIPGIDVELEAKKNGISQHALPYLKRYLTTHVGSVCSSYE